MQDDDVIIEPEDGEGSTKTPEQKIKELKETLKRVEKERTEYLDGWQRSKADYVNAKKRFEEDRLREVKAAAEGIVSDILPVIDSFEQALAHAEPDSDLAKGITNTYTQLLTALAAHGLVQSDPLGETFDPSLQEPVETLEVKSESEDNVVTKVHQKGYTLHGRTIRPARVQIGHFKPADSGE